MVEDALGGKRALSQSRSLGPVHHVAAEITWVTFLILWNQSGIDESTYMMEGRVVFRQGLLSKVPKEFNVAGTSNQSPAASLCSTWQQKPACCTGSRRESSMLQIREGP